MTVPALRGSSLTMDVLAALSISSDLEVAYFPDFARGNSNFVEWCGVNTDLYKSLEPLGILCKTQEEAAVLAKKMLASITD